MNFRSMLRVFLIVLGSCLVAGTVLGAADRKASGPPVDLAGNWYGTFKAGQERGTASLVLEQSGGTSGTYYGAIVFSTGAVGTVFGDYTVQGRKIVYGNMTVASGGRIDSGRLKGKAAKTALELKLKVRMPDATVKVNLVRQ